MEKFEASNVLGTPLIPCGTDPITGFFRDGFCRSCREDVGNHTICAVMTGEFLRFSKGMGNDLVTPHPEWHFPGLKEGDSWCLCLGRWLEALEAGVAPPVVLESTHLSVLEFVSLEILRENSHA